MIEPVPNCFSIERMAAATAFPRSAVTRSVATRSPLRSSVIAIPSRSFGFAADAADPFVGAFAASLTHE
jgi:hypothetical protein